MGGASAQEERWRDTRSSCSLRSAALQDGGSAQAQEEVGHKKERRPRWRTWEEWKRDMFKEELDDEAAVWGQLRKKEEEMFRGKVEGTDVVEQKCSSLM